MDAAHQWREGTFFPRWAEWANWGFGEPRFIFYPPASWMLGAALGTLLPWAMAPGAFVWLALIAAGMSMWRLVREGLPARHATVAAVLFAVNPYHLVIVYYRSDFAELLAGACLPLVIWAALQVVRGDRHRVPLLAAAFAAVWLSNAPAAVITTYTLVLILAVSSAVRQTLWPLVPGGVAMSGGFGLAAFYILPAAWERRWVQIAQAVADNLEPARNFLFTRANDPDFVTFNWRVSWVAVALMLVTILALALVASKRAAFPELFRTLAALAVVSSVLMFPISHVVWRVLPEIRYVQFPWRWLEVLAVAFAFFVAAALYQFKYRGLSWLFGVAVFLAIALAGAGMIRSAWWDTGDLGAMLAAIHSGAGYRGTDEYDPVGCDRYELPGDPDDTERTEGVSASPAQRVEQLDSDSGDVVPASDAGIRIGKWSPGHRELLAEVHSPVILALKLLNYPAWELSVDGRRTAPGAAHDTGQMLVSLAPGRHAISIRFRRTRDRKAGGAISILSAISLLGLFWQTRKPSPRA